VDEATDLAALAAALRDPDTGTATGLRLITQGQRWQDPRPMIAATCAAAERVAP